MCCYFEMAGPSAAASIVAGELDMKLADRPNAPPTRPIFTKYEYVPYVHNSSLIFLLPLPSLEFSRVGASFEEEI